MGYGGGLAAAANFRTVPKFSVESTNACLTKLKKIKDLCEVSKTTVTFLISCTVGLFSSQLDCFCPLSYELCFCEVNNLDTLHSVQQRIMLLSS